MNVFITQFASNEGHLDLNCFETQKLVKGQTSVTISLENLANGIDVSSRAEVKSKVVGHGGIHDGSSASLHGVVEARVNNILF